MLIRRTILQLSLGQLAAAIYVTIQEKLAKILTRLISENAALTGIAVSKSNTVMI